MRTSSLSTLMLSCLFLSAGCAAEEEGVATESETGGTDGSGVVSSSGAGPGVGGTTGSGGLVSGSGNSSSGGASSTGGQAVSGGAGPGDGASSSGGVFSSGGAPGGNNSGGADTGGDSSGGDSSGGSSSGGSSSGGDSSGGSSSGGDSSGGSSSSEVDCDAQMPTSGGEQHSATWAEGGSGNLSWQIWSNGSAGNLTSYDVPAFTTSWNNSGDFLGRMGFEWGSSGKKYTEYGSIKADYVWNKSGNAGSYSYLGIYGWSTNPCVEWYIVEDSFHNMPFNTGDQPVGTVDIDGGTYNLVYRNTSGTGGDRCGGAGSWDQFYSIRLEGKRCGTIDVTKHFDAWADQGWNLGDLLEVKIVVEAAAGTGSVDFPVANVTTTR